MSNVTWERRHEALKAIRDAILSALTAAPEDKKVVKVGFWEDANGNIKYIKFYDGAELLFTLTFSNAGVATSETWSVERS